MKRAKRHYDMTARAAKAAATRARIRASAAQLYCGEAIENFTLEEVARRAGTSVQTVLRVFATKDELIYAALEEMAAGGVFMKPTRPGDVRAAVTAFFDIYETVGDLVVQRLADERRRPALKRSLDQGRENHLDGVKTVFAPQLARHQGASRAQLLTILNVMTDVYVWKLLRRDMGLDRPAAEAVVRRMITSVTEGEEAHGTDPVAELVGRRESAS
jgi:AcrR family transcriptional regulator